MLDHPVIDLPLRGTIGKDIADALLLTLRVGPVVHNSSWHGDACEDEFVYVCIEWIVVKWLKSWWLTRRGIMIEALLLYLLPPLDLPVYSMRPSAPRG
jgi:hypothetical protein